MQKRRVVALVPLRGGSKSIPHKNIKPIAGRPLCAWVLEAAAKTKGIDEVWVSTDSAKISEIVEGLDLGIKVLKRPAKFATDTASTESVMLHFAEKVQFDWLVTIQATSPLTTSADLSGAIKKFEKEKLDSLLTGVYLHSFFWDKSCSPVNYDPAKRLMRQKFKDGLFMENGAFYITKRPLLEKTECRLGGKIGIWSMPETYATELDEPWSWSIVEHLLMENRRQSLAKTVSRVKMLVLDVDGTLTDGGMYYNNDGELLKQFNTRDGQGLELVRKSGITVAVITKENSPIAMARARKLGIKHVFVGIKDKQKVLKDLCRKLNVKLSEVAYVGDDISDLSCIEAVGMPCAPADAMQVIKKKAIYIAQKKGGRGAVREVCEALIAGQANSNRP